jgi:hypothetical protein
MSRNFKFEREAPKINPLASKPSFSKNSKNKVTTIVNIKLFFVISRKVFLARSTLPTLYYLSPFNPFLLKKSRLYKRGGIQ